MNKAVTLTLALLLVSSIAWGAADAVGLAGGQVESRDRSRGTLIQESDVRHPAPLPPTDAEYFYDNGSAGSSTYIGWPDWGYPQYGVKFTPGFGEITGLRAYVRRLYTWYTEELLFDVYDDNGGVPGNHIYTTPTYVNVYDANWYDWTMPSPLFVEEDFYVCPFTTMYSSYYVWLYWDNNGDQAPSGTQWYYYYWMGWSQDYNSGDLMIRCYFDPQKVNDVGVSKILQPSGLLCTCDTLKPKVTVKNSGSADQFGVPVQFLAYDDLGVLKYSEEVTCDVAANSELDVDFPYGDPLGYNTVLTCSAYTKLGTDEKTSNDTTFKTQKVNEYADVQMTYNDGAPENGVTWYATESNNAVRFAGDCVVQKIMIGIMAYGGQEGDYDCDLQILLNDGDAGMPGTVVWEAVDTTLHGLGYPDWGPNYIEFVPPVAISTDSFFVNWIPHQTAPPFIAVDMTPPIDIGNDFGTAPGSTTWGPFQCYYSDAQCDMMMDASYGGYLHDVSIASIDVPPAVIDSGTSFSPQITVANVGLKARPGSQVDFFITDTGGVKVFSTTATSGALGPGATEVFTFPDVLTLLPTDYMDSAIITCPAHDADHSNDTLDQALFVRYLDIYTEVVRPMPYEVPGAVPTTVRLTNKGNVPALVPQVDVTITGGYNDHKHDIPLDPGQVVDLYFTPWVSIAGEEETCVAWITYPEDMNHSDPISADTDVVVVKSGIPGWMEMTPLPAPPSGKSVKDGGCLAYDAGTELIYGSKGNKTGDFYTYNTVGNAWTNKAGIPLGAEGKQVGKGSVICADGNGKLYLTKGNNTPGFWEYDAATNAWIQKTNVPLGSSGKKVKQGAGLAWGSKGGIGYAYLLKGYRNEFYKYDPVTNQWFFLLDAPIGTHLKWDAGSWLCADPTSSKLYAAKGKYHEFYSYDTEKDSWSAPLKPMPIPGSAGNKKAKEGSCAAYYSGKIYALKGGNTTEFWRYHIVGDSWHKQDDIPLSGVSGARKKVKAGAALAQYPGMGVFAFKGNKSLEFWKFTPYDIAAGAQPGRDGVTAGSLDITGVSFAIAPNPVMGGLAKVSYSLPKAGLATLDIYDVTGRTVLSQTVAAGRTGSASLDLRKLEAGVYLVKVATEGFSTTQKLVVQH